MVKAFNAPVLVSVIMGVIIIFLQQVSRVKAEEIIFQNDAYSITRDKVVQGKTEVEIKSPVEMIRRPDGKIWQLERDISMYPAFKSDYPVSDALYNMSVEEMCKMIEADGTFRTGQLWGGVWTRDISYSVILAFAYIRPDIARQSLMRKVKEGKIIQDTGTGGSYPVSTDRMIWAVAAYEVYKVTGDHEWLKQVYAVVVKSIAQDEDAVYDKDTGLVRGESTFLDWRKQEYPRWMQPTDISQSECLGTSAVHYMANQVAAQIAEQLDDPDGVTRFNANAERIKSGINHYLWQESRGFYAQFRYGRHYQIVSPKSETLGEALCVIYGIASNEQAARIISSVEQTPYGIPCFSPQIPDMPAYHNNAIWPFVQSYWLWASAETGNEESVLKSISAIYRAAAIFETNKENFVAADGGNKTLCNSDSQLWSIAGNISIIYRQFFGISFLENEMLFKPFIPKALAGKKTLTNFKYRDAIFDLDIDGYGNKIVSFQLDGKDSEPMISADIRGRHHISMILANQLSQEPRICRKEVRFSPETPVVTLQKNSLIWAPIKSAIEYRIIRNGKILTAIKQNAYIPCRSNCIDEYQVVAVDKTGAESFASEPVDVGDIAKNLEINMIKFAAKADYPYMDFTGDGFIEIAATKNTKIDMPVEIPEAGLYAISFRYSNGNGAFDQENKCAIRTLLLNGKEIGVFVFPQRGKNNWSNWGFSNSIPIRLEKGRQTFSLVYENTNENMNDDRINQAMLNYLSLVRLQ